MEIAELVNVLDHPHVAADHLQAWGLRDVHRGQRTLVELAEGGLTLDLLASLSTRLGKLLVLAPDPDAALDAFRRFLFASRSPLSLAALLERDGTALPMLVKVLSFGPAWCELLIRDPEAFDLLRMTDGQPVARAALVADVCAEVASFTDERSVSAALDRIKQRETLRIAYGEVVARHRCELVAEQLTFLAEAILEAALRAARRKAIELKAGSSPTAAAVVALGRLGGAEMDYGSDLELLVVYDPTAADEAGRRQVQEAWERAARLLVRLLSGTDNRPIYRVRLQALPDSQSPALAHAVEDVVFGLDSFGRTWHRQAMLKARIVAGDAKLGEDVLNRLTPWLFRRYWSRADDSGVKALKRRLLRRASAPESVSCDIDLSRGGLSDLETVVQFLQLLRGGDQPQVRTANTLNAIAGLEQSGAITVEERRFLEEHYLALRHWLQRVQLATSPPSSAIPADASAQARLWALLGSEMSARSIEAGSLSGLCRQKLVNSWGGLVKIIGPEDAEPAPAPIVDLLLNPVPDPGETRAILSNHGFADEQAALVHLQQLATERVPFLSTRRCRYFLSVIASDLVTAIASTPDPDFTLANLSSVSNSLGAKGVLWELFSFHPPSLDLYVRLCAASPYLSGILTTNPGMIDDLVNSLQLDKLPTLEELESTLAELSRSSSETIPILHDLKNASHLRIGIRDILGKDNIASTHRALANVAEFCLGHVVRREYAKLVEKHGQPAIGPGPFEGEPCGPVILACGKLGGREPNYHSDLEVAFLYEAEGTTRPAGKGRREQRTTNNHFFTQLAQRVMKEMTQLSPQGRLYPLEIVLRPIGVGGALALSFADLAQHFMSGAAPVWQWQILCKARCIFGEHSGRESVERLLKQLLTSRSWEAQDASQIAEARRQSEQGAALHNVKRGPGGTMDVEAAVQMLQLRHASKAPEILLPGTVEAIVALQAAGFMDKADGDALSQSYNFLRRVESGLRLQNTSARHDLPTHELELKKLALLLNHERPDQLPTQVLSLMEENRRRFLTFVEALKN